MNVSRLALIAASVLLVACGGGGGQSGRPDMPGGKRPSGGGGGGAPASGYQGGSVSGGGTIAGVISYSGGETDTKAEITKDDAVCAVHGKTIADHALTVNGGKVKDVIVWLDGLKEGKPLTKRTVTVDNKDCMFVPRVSIGWKGDKINAKNSDAVLHNTHLKLNGKTVHNVALPTKDQQLQKPLKKSGLYEITCDAHAWMKAYMFVADNPYVEISNDGGSFTMTDVPAGSYELNYWHEILGEGKVSVTVTSGGTAQANIAL
ncbi:MAG: hypothetical protein AAF533_25030 [Acidobacteriota bacterium]